MKGITIHHLFAVYPYSLLASESPLSHILKESGTGATASNTPVQEGNTLKEGTGMMASHPGPREILPA
jgi:hypothetical protein